MIPSESNTKLTFNQFPNSLIFYHFNQSGEISSNLVTRDSRKRWIVASISLSLFLFLVPVLVFVLSFLIIPSSMLQSGQALNYLSVRRRRWSSLDKIRNIWWKNGARKRWVMALGMENSVTRFGEKSPLWHYVKSLWLFIEGLLDIWPNSEHILAKFVCFWANFNCSKCHPAIWSHWWNPPIQINFI